MEQAQEKENIIKALSESYGIVTSACNATGLPRSTFYRWLKEDTEFKAAVDDVQESTIDVVEGELFKLIKSGETAAILFYLKTKAKKRGYIERQEFTGSDGTPLVPSPQLIIQQVGGPGLKTAEEETGGG